MVIRIRMWKLVWASNASSQGSAVFTFFECTLFPKLNSWRKWNWDPWFKSKVKTKTLNPTFKENFSLKFGPGETTIQITVWDRFKKQIEYFILTTFKGHLSSKWFHWISYSRTSKIRAWQDAQAGPEAERQKERRCRSNWTGYFSNWYGNRFSASFQWG